MCLNPITINSPKLKAGTYLQGVDKSKLVVPCGHCPECNLQKVKNLTFRAYFEWLKCKSYTFSSGSKGFALFNTLTYSELHVPRQGGFDFFCKKDLQKFLKRLRIKLTRDGYHVDGNFSYLITCEYGEKYKRPHYHTIFFVTFDITPQLFDAYVVDAWKNLGNRYVTTSAIGITDYKDVSQRVVNSIYAIQYVCKYVFKGTSVVDAIKYKGWSEISHFAYDYVNYEDSGLKWKDLQDWQVSNIWQSYVSLHPEMKDFQLLPFYLQSKGLGMKFLEDCAYDELFDVVQIPSRSSTGYTDFHIPMYYIRKVFYDYDSVSKRFILNELGKDFKKNINHNLCENYKDMLDHNLNFVDSICRDKYGSSFCEVVDTYLNGRTKSQFIKYVVYLKDRYISPIHDFLLPEKDSKQLFNYLDEFCELVENDIFEQTIADNPSWFYHEHRDIFGRIVNIDKYSTGVFIRYNELPCFKGFDVLYNILCYIKRELSKAKCYQISVDIIKYRNEKLADSVIKEPNAVYY